MKKQKRSDFDRELSRIDSNIDNLDRSMVERLNSLIGLAKTMKDAYLDSKCLIAQTKEFIAQLKAKN